jgi:hypothetical protein
MATITVVYDTHSQAQAAIAALRERGIADEHIQTDDDESGGVRVSVEAEDEGARIVRDMMEEHRLPLGSPGYVEGRGAPDLIEDDDAALAAGAAIGVGTTAAGSAMGNTTVGPGAIGGRRDWRGSGAGVRG